MQGWGDSPLTPLGQQQATRHGELLKRENVEEIHASDLGRVRQTIECIQKNCIVETSYHETLREFNMGAWEGQKVECIERHDPDTYLEWRRGDGDIAAPEGESKQAVKRRVSSTLESITSDCSGSVAFVTHGGTTRVLLELLLELTQAQKNEIRIPNNVVHRIDITSETPSVVHFRDGGPPLEGICSSWT